MQEEGRTVSEIPTVRYVNVLGERKRLWCATIEEAEFECARLALDLSHGNRPEPERDLTLGEFWPTWRADADTRLAEATLQSYDRLWNRLVAPRFGDTAFVDIRPRAVAGWRREMLEAGVGNESVRMALLLLQAMFRLAIEWGEARVNPVSVVRKPRQGRQRAVRVMSPDAVEQIRAQMLKNGLAHGGEAEDRPAYAVCSPGRPWRASRRRRHHRSLLTSIARSC